MVTARFIVSRCTPQGDTENPYSYEVEMTPDYSQGRNEEWKKATPAGVIRLTIDPEKTNAVELLQQGQHLEVQLIPIEDPLKV